VTALNDNTMSKTTNGPDSVKSVMEEKKRRLWRERPGEKASFKTGMGDYTTDAVRQVNRFRTEE